MEKLSDIKKKSINKYIYIYGAGTYALHMCEYLTNESLKVEGFIVSSVKDIEDRCLLGIPVYTLNEIKHSPRICNIILALSESYQKDIQELMHINGYVNIMPFSDRELKEIKHKMDLFSMEMLHKYAIQNENKRKSGENILIVRMDGIGDMVMTTPFLRELHRNHPNARITLVTSPESSELFDACPYLYEVIPYDYKKKVKYPLKMRIEDVWRFVSANLKLGQYDFAFVPRWDTDWYGASFISFFSGANHRIGYSENVNPDKAYNNHNYDMMFNNIIEHQTLKHEVERNMDMLLEMHEMVCDTSLELWETASDRYRIKRILEDFAQDGERIVAVGISASMDSKKWDMKNYLRLVQSLRIRKLKFVIIGGVEDTSVSQNMFSDDSILNLVGKISLREIVALMRCVVLYIGNDTGVMHIAAACGVRIVEIRGDDGVLDSTKRFHPWGVDYLILEPKIGEQCVGINSISVDDVVEKINYFLG